MLLLRLLKESILFAIGSLVVNRLRTFLSLLGITIGIFSIISVFTVIDSLERNIRENIETLGDNVIYIEKWPWTPPPGEEEYPWWKYLNRPVPKIQEQKEIQKRSKKAEASVFIIQTNKTVQYKSNSAQSVEVLAVSENFDKVRFLEFQDGRYFTPFELSGGKNNVILGSLLAEKLFDRQDPIDKTIKIAGRKAKIVGIFKKEGDDMFMMNMDNVVVVPVNFIRNIVDLKSEMINPSILVKAKKDIENEELIDEMNSIMRSVRKLKPAEENDFALNRSSMITNVIEKIFSTIYVAGGFIGLFSIIVGGFGIANIMYVSVKERTPIIGIQKAIGAKKYFILIQFLSESIILTLIGGIFGLILIYAGTLIANELVDFTFTLSVGNIMTGVFISIGIGIVSGFAPALSASRLNPVKAISSNF